MGLSNTKKSVFSNSINEQNQNRAAEKKRVGESASVVQAAEAVIQTTEPVVQTPITTEPVLKPDPIIEKETVSKPVDGLELILSKKSNNGHQKSVYITDDNFRYIKEKCDKTGAKFSDVINFIIKHYRESQV